MEVCEQNEAWIIKDGDDAPKSYSETTNTSGCGVSGAEIYGAILSELT
jgi:hypothetical protein